MTLEMTWTSTVVSRDLDFSSLTQKDLVFLPILKLNCMWMLQSLSLAMYEFLRYSPLSALSGGLSSLGAQALNKMGPSSVVVLIFFFILIQV